nr:lipopolysaccharide biosynthesis protein RfbH [uncultured Agathobaculum sp.]
MHETEHEFRSQILQLVKNYSQKYHNRKEYEHGDYIPYAGRIYDSDELCALVDASLDFWLTSGRYTDAFENKLAQYLNVPYCSLVNSGSSANLLAFSALTSPLLGNRRIVRGDEVITVAAGFPTTVAPIVQYGAIPVYVDISLPTYNIDVSMLQQALSSKTKAVMIAHTLGNPFDLTAVRAFCDEHGLWLIEDNCDALGAMYCLDGKWHMTGTIGDIGTSSFYPAHHITMGEGGAVYTKDSLLHKIIRSLRDWGRECVCPGGQDNTCGHRFSGQFGTLPVGYDHKYVYSHFGYNLKVTDMQAAIGTAQLDKLSSFVKARRENWNFLKNALHDLCDILLLPEETPNAYASWFGFLITVNRTCPASRAEIVNALEAAGIQTRPLFSGNLLRHPCVSSLTENVDYRIISSLSITDQTMEHSFWVGVYPGMCREMLEEIVAQIRKAVGH